MTSTLTYSVDVQRSGYIRIEAFVAPAVAPTPCGYEHPPRTVAEVKALARSKVDAMGGAFSKRAAREAIRYLTKYDCENSKSISF